jgi:hypothetical protein
VAACLTADEIDMAGPDSMQLQRMLEQEVVSKLKIFESATK